MLSLEQAPRAAFFDIALGFLSTYTGILNQNRTSGVLSVASGGNVDPEIAYGARKTSVIH
jgi:hypothetical protein